MSILLAVGMFVFIVVFGFIGMLLAGPMNFSRFGSSGLALFGSGGSFAICLTVAVVSGGGVLTWVFVGLAALIFGMIMRGATNA